MRRHDGHGGMSPAHAAWPATGQQRRLALLVLLIHAAMDLGWMLATWYRPGSQPVLPNQLMVAGGLATPDELIERYAGNTDRDVSRIDWYAVLACFKLGIILLGSHARTAAGLAPKEIGDVLHTATVRLFERALAIMEGER
jgi:aminoglycoside phosphotransferase (APT) family kinase protein